MQKSEDENSHSLMSAHDTVHDGNVLSGNVIHDNLSNLRPPEHRPGRRMGAREIVCLEIPVPQEEEVAALECWFHAIVDYSRQLHPACVHGEVISEPKRVVGNGHDSICAENYCCCDSPSGQNHHDRAGTIGRH